MLVNSRLSPSPQAVDVLCIGHASYDMVFSVARHPAEDEKIFADAYLGCGGGPAANAAVTVARLGYKSAFAGYLGNDVYGEHHLQELLADEVETQWIVRGVSPTPLSAIIVKPDGKRALINYKGDTRALPAEAINFSSIVPKVALFDGHEPHLAVAYADDCRKQNITTVLDAGSVHEGTLMLLEKSDYAACSEKFARQYAGNIDLALQQLAEKSPAVIITLGDHGLVWRRGAEQGRLPAFPVTAVDTTGAGDAFHGALAAAVAAELEWSEALWFASAAGALCCTKTGARQGLPSQAEHRYLYEQRHMLSA